MTTPSWYPAPQRREGNLHAYKSLINETTLRKPEESAHSATAAQGHAVLVVANYTL